MEKKTVLVTGANGAIGSELVSNLVDQGYHVLCMVRGESPRERMRAVIGDKAEQLSFLSGNIDMTNEYCGVCSEDLTSWKGKIHAVIHVAGILKFQERDTEVQNEVGTTNMLYLTKALGCQKFYFFSTAYVAGTAMKFGESDYDVGQKPNNNYEASKFVCEKMVRNSCLDWTILRPGIVTGRQTDGHIADFSGYYTWFSAFHRLYWWLNGLWVKNEKTLSPAYNDKFVLESSGVSFDESGYMTLPLRIDCGAKPVTANFVPLDYLCGQFMVILKSGDFATKKVFHLVNPTPPMVEDLITYSMDILKIKGWTFRKDPIPTEKQLPFLKDLQNKMDKAVRPYLAYTHQGVDLGRQENVRAAHEHTGVPYQYPREFTRDHYEMLLAKACAKSFGYSKRPKTH